jgi:hypothetical protein
LAEVRKAKENNKFVNYESEIKYQKLMKNRFGRTIANKKLEHHMAQIKLIDGLKKMDITDILYDGDKMFENKISPWVTFADEALADENVP